MNWMLLADATEFYTRHGYQYIEVPWIVDDTIARQTFDGEGLMCQLGTLIGSAEQGFLALDMPEGKYVSCSPCFRNEPVIDRLHQAAFMKVELYMNGSHTDEILHDALDFSNMYLDATAQRTAEGWDIMAGDIEIGSYGERRVGDRHWTYGTGLALPRFSLAMEEFNAMVRCPLQSRC